MEITPEKLYAMYLTAHNLLTQCTPTQDISLSCRLGTPPTVLKRGESSSFQEDNNCVGIVY